jgi:3-oxoacyl-(acyl-carrier-protein) synthase
MSPKDLRALVGSVVIVFAPAMGGHGMAAAAVIEIAVRRLKMASGIISAR